MNGCSLAVFALFLHAGVAAGATGATGSVATVTDELIAAEQAFAEAFAARDLERFASFIHEDAVFTGPAGPLQGRAAVLEVWSRYFEPDEAPFNWTPARALVNDAGNLGVTTGPVRDGDDRHVGAFTSTWTKTPDGTWQVIFDITPSCPPPPE